jgi:hypothetical protein
MASFWSDIVDDHTGPELTDALIADAEAALGFTLPASYLRVLWLRNGGYPVRCRFPTAAPTSWAPDHIQITTLFGVWPGSGLLASRRLIRARNLPAVGIVIADTPSGCGDAVMLDYSQCGPTGEPRVVYAEPDVRAVTELAPTFEAFVRGLEVGTADAD